MLTCHIARARVTPIVEEHGSTLFWISIRFSYVYKNFAHDIYVGVGVTPKWMSHSNLVPLLFVLSNPIISELVKHR